MLSSSVSLVYIRKSVETVFKQLLVERCSLDMEAQRLVQQCCAKLTLFYTKINMLLYSM